MLRVAENGTIELTRGDSAAFLVSITNDNTNSDYDISENDTLTMTVKKSFRNAEHLIQKVVKGTNTFSFVPADTSNLEFGTYTYDVQLTTASGDVYTVIPPSKFTLLSEVTW